MLVLSLRDLNPTTIHQDVFLLHIMTEIYLKNATKSPLLHSYFHHFSQNPSVFFYFILSAWSWILGLKQQVGLRPPNIPKGNFNLPLQVKVDNVK